MQTFYRMYAMVMMDDDDDDGNDDIVLVFSLPCLIPPLLQFAMAPVQNITVVHICTGATKLV